jgi:DNA-binding NarL/FixJ family response regulator
MNPDHREREVLQLVAEGESNKEVATCLTRASIPSKRIEPTSCKN